MRVNRIDQKRTLEEQGIDFRADYHELHSTHVEMLIAAADQSRYRKPEHANGSRARYFFYHLARLREDAQI